MLPRVHLKRRCEQSLWTTQSLDLSNDCNVPLWNINHCFPVLVFLPKWNKQKITFPLSCLWNAFGYCSNSAFQMRSLSTRRGRMWTSEQGVGVLLKHQWGTLHGGQCLVQITLVPGSQTWKSWFRTRGMNRTPEIQVQAFIQLLVTARMSCNKI